MNTIFIQVNVDIQTNELKVSSRPKFTKHYIQLHYVFINITQPMNYDMTECADYSTLSSPCCDEELSPKLSNTTTRKG